MKFLAEGKADLLKMGGELPGLVSARLMVHRLENRELGEHFRLKTLASFAAEAAAKNPAFFKA